MGDQTIQIYNLVSHICFLLKPKAIQGGKELHQENSVVRSRLRGKHVSKGVAFVRKCALPQNACT